MAKTLVSDVIIPTEFEKYAIERTAELSNFGQCGSVAGPTAAVKCGKRGGERRAGGCRLSALAGKRKRSFRVRCRR